MRMRPPLSKIRSYADAVTWRQSLQAEGRRLVMTNGCFDLLHRGHVEYLNKARDLGDALLVAINSDESLRRLKGPARPLVAQEDRAYLLSALECIDCVVIFPGNDCRDVIEAAAPDIYVKGGDYTVETMNQDERVVLERVKSHIEFMGFIPGYSTSQLIAKIKYDESQPPRK